MIARLQRLVSALLLVGATVAAGRAQTAFTWTGASGYYVSHGGNWSGGVAPALSSPAADLVFGAPGSGTNYVAFDGSGTDQVKSLTFANTSQYYVKTHHGTTLGIGSGGIGVSHATGYSLAVEFWSSLNLELLANQTWAVDNGTLTVYGAIGGNHALTKTGTGSLKLASSDSDFSGGLTVSGGTLVLQAGSSGSANHPDHGAVGTGTLTLGDGTTLSAATENLELHNHVHLGDNITFGAANATGLTLLGHVEAQQLATTIHLAGSEPTEFRGPLSGPGSGARFTFAGSGSAVLGGNSYYTGGTTLEAGSVYAESNLALGIGPVSIAAGRLHVASGVTLANSITFSGNDGSPGGFLLGTGTLSGAVTLDHDGGVSPGTDTTSGQLAFANGLIFGASGHYQLNLGDTAHLTNPGVDYDTLAIAGNLDVAATLANPFGVYWNDAPAHFSSASAAQWRIATADSVTNFDAGRFRVDDANGELGGFTLSLSDSQLLLAYTPASVWTGASDHALSTPANWQGGTAPSLTDGTAWIRFAAANLSAPNTIVLPAAADVAKLTFGTSHDDNLRFTLTGPATLTLRHGVYSATADRGNGGVHLTFGDTVNLVLAQSQWVEFNASSSVDFQGVISESGDSRAFGIKAGNHRIRLAGANTFSGGFVAEDDNTVVIANDHAFGSGTVTIGGGVTLTAEGHRAVGNPIVFAGDTAYLREADPDSSDPSDSLAFHGTLALTRSFSLGSYSRSDVTLWGAIGETAGSGHSFSYASSSGSTLLLAGANTYTGGTYVVDGALIFTTASAVPATGQIKSDRNAYVGLADPNAVAAFLGKLHPTDFAGTLGFDSLGDTTTTFGAAIDLRNLSGAPRLGTRTSATILGEIQVASGEDLAFAGTGKLAITSALSGSHTLTVGDELELFLRGHNTFTTTAGSDFAGIAFVFDHARLFLDAAGALPASGDVYLGSASAYIGATENYPTTATAFVDRVQTTSDSFGGMVGFDSGNPAHPRTVSDAIDLSDGGQRVTSLYLGTASKVILTGTLTPASGQPLYLGATPGAHLIVNSNLGSGLGGVVIGSSAWTGTVELGGTNTFTGGLVIQGGELLVSSAASLGPDSLSTAAGSTTTLRVSAADTVIANALHLGYNASLNLGKSGDASAFTLSGPITGNDSTGAVNKRGENTVTLSGTNSFASLTVTGGTLVVGSSGALGSAHLTLAQGTLSAADGVTVTRPVHFDTGVSGLKLLGGNGTFATDLTFATQAGLAPGHSVGTLHLTGNVTWGPGGVYQVDVQDPSGAAGVGYDTTVIGGTLTFNATLGDPFTIYLQSLTAAGASGNLATFSATQAYSWKIATTGGLVDFDAANIAFNTSGFANSLDGGSFGLTTVGHDVFVNFTPAAVPEPSTWALLLAGLGFVAWFARRRQ